MLLGLNILLYERAFHILKLYANVRYFYFPVVTRMLNASSLKLSLRASLNKNLKKKMCVCKKVESNYVIVLTLIISG